MFFSLKIKVDRNQQNPLKKERSVKKMGRMTRDLVAIMGAEQAQENQKAQFSERAQKACDFAVDRGAMIKIFKKENGARNTTKPKTSRESPNQRNWLQQRGKPFSKIAGVENFSTQKRR